MRELTIRIWSELSEWIWSELSEWVPDRFLPKLTDQPNQNQDSSENVEDVCPDYVYMDGGHQCYNLSLQDSGKVKLWCFFIMTNEVFLM